MTEDSPLAGGAVGLQLRTRLELLFEWYKEMVSPDTGRLIYLYDPEDETIVANGHPVRDLAAVRDLGALSRFLGKAELLPVVDASLAHWRSTLIPHGTGLVLDAARIGEPTGIAHSALLLLALSDWDVPERDGLVRALAEGILHQQRRDGSYRIFFGEEADTALEFIPGAAMLALLEATRRTGDPRFRASAERALGWYGAWWSSGHVDPDVAVFYADAQSQAAARLCLDGEREEVRRAARDHLFALQDGVLRSGFYPGLRGHPLGQPTIQVACALEGVNAAYAEALRTGDAERAGRYRACALVALAHLAEAQIVDGGTERETGGFAYSSNERTQRIDVAGRVASGFMRSVENGLDEEPAQG